MSANQALFPIAAMARVFGVSTAGYYAWRSRPPSTWLLPMRRREASTFEVPERASRIRYEYGSLSRRTENAVSAASSDLFAALIAEAENP